MSRSRGLAQGLCALLIATAGACETDPGDGEPAVERPELPYAYETEHLEIHANMPLCEGDFARWEGFIEHAAGYLGADMPASTALYVWDGETFADLSEPLCGPGTAGCTSRARRVIYSSRGSVEHELVHALANQFENADAFFAEGLAVALAEPVAAGVLPVDFPIEQSRDVDFGTAGHFVRWLLESRDPELLKAHLQTSGTIVEFEGIYGESLDSMAETSLVDAPWFYPGLYRYPAPELEADGAGRWRSALDYDCARDDVRGTEAGLVVVRAMELPESGFYSLWSSTGGKIRGTRVLEQTYETPEDHAEATSFLRFDIPPDTLGALPLEAGRYELEITAPAGVEAGEFVVWRNLGPQPVFPEEAP